MPCQPHKQKQRQSSVSWSLLACSVSVSLFLALCVAFSVSHFLFLFNSHMVPPPLPLFFLFPPFPVLSHHICLSLYGYFILFTCTKCEYKVITFHIYTQKSCSYIHICIHGICIIYKKCMSILYSPSLRKNSTSNFKSSHVSLSRYILFISAVTLSLFHFLYCLCLSKYFLYIACQI